MKAALLTLICVNISGMEFNPIPNPPRLFIEQPHDDALAQMYCDSDRLKDAEHALKNKELPENIIQCPIEGCEYIKYLAAHKSLEKNVRLTQDSLRHHMKRRHNVWDREKTFEYIQKCISSNYDNSRNIYRFKIVYEFECYCPGCNDSYICSPIEKNQLEKLFAIKLEEMCQHFATHETINSQDYDQLIRTHFKILKKYQAQ